MYIIEMVDDWDRTIQTWIVNRSEEEVSDFVNTMNSGLADKLRKEVKSNTECYFYYRKCNIIDLPTEEEIKDLLKPSEFELSMKETSDSDITYDMIKDWNIEEMLKATDMMNMFKNCK